METSKMESTDIRQVEALFLVAETDAEPACSATAVFL